MPLLHERVQLLWQPPLRTARHVKSLLLSCSWQIKYEDSDCEDVEWPELRKLLADATLRKSSGGNGGGGGLKKGGGHKSQNPTKAAL